jgi:hypothetical protein
MLNHEYVQMRPLYEAMFLSSSTLAWLEGTNVDRSDFRLQEGLAGITRSMEEFIEMASKREIVSSDLPGSIFLVESLNCMTQLVDAKTREFLPMISTPLERPIGLLLDQIDTLTDRVEEILEAWQIGADPAGSARLTQAVSQIDSTKTEISEWRVSLEQFV